GGSTSSKRVRPRMARWTRDDEHRRRCDGDSFGEEVFGGEHASAPIDLRQRKSRRAKVPKLRAALPIAETKSLIRGALRNLGFGGGAAARALGARGPSTCASESRDEPRCRNPRRRRTAR